VPIRNLARPVLARFRDRPAAALPAALAVALGLGWAGREVAFAREQAKQVAAQTVTLDQVEMKPYTYEGSKPLGKLGIYLAGDTPASDKFVTGRLVLDPGQTPHPPHTHVEEEVMVIESGTGEIVVAGKVTKIGPGSVMYTTPNVAHGITNTGDTPIVFYFIKWAAKK